MKKKLKMLVPFMALTVFASIGLNSSGFTSSAKVAANTNLTGAALSYKYWNTSLTYGERAADLISHMTLTEKISELSTHPSSAISRLGVAEYWWPGEADHGIGNIGLWYKVSDPVSTIFPNDLGQGSTWNPDLIQSMASMIGDEARAYYNESNKGLAHWAPTINEGRDPRWGRSDEYYSEDPFLTAAMGTAYVNGFQNDKNSKYLKAIAVMKHFAANSSEENRYYSSSDMDERTLREYYTSQFENVIKNTNVAGTMSAYNAVNGTPCCANKYLLVDVLRKTFGFNGFVVSDNPAPALLYKYSKQNSKNGQYWTNYKCSSYEQATADSLQAGCDICLAAGDNAIYKKYAQSAIDKGLLSEDDVDKALLELFTVRFRTGEFDTSNKDFSNIKTVEDYVYNDKTHQNAAEEVAEQSTVMLENNGILPFKASGIKSLVVVGEAADTVNYGPYSSSDTAKKKTIEKSPYKAISDKYLAANPTGKIELITPDRDSSGNCMLDSVQLNKVAAADAVIAYLDTTQQIDSTKTAMFDPTNSDSGEMVDRKNLDLPRKQAEMAQELIAANAKTVVYMQTCSQVNVNSFNKKAAALLWCTYNGQAQGPACADLLFGDANPSGRLTMTWYADDTQLGDLYNNYAIRSSSISHGKTYMYFNGDVTYPFGYGLSYTSFRYANMSLSKTKNVTGDDKITAAVYVTNTGKVDGYNVAQLYVNSPKGYSERPYERLEGFKKVWLKAGQTQKVSITFDVSSLSFWNESKNAYALDLGIYTVNIGSNSDDIYASATFNAVKAQTLAVKIVAASPDRVVFTEKGDSMDSSISVTMNNDYLYSTVNEIPSNLGIKVTYTSSNPNVAKVDKNGIVTSVGNGVATIKAIVTMNGVSKTGSFPIAVAY